MLDPDDIQQNRLGRDLAILAHMLSAVVKGGMAFKKDAEQVVSQVD